jgi:hypothetical protein
MVNGGIVRGVTPAAPSSYGVSRRRPSVGERGRRRVSDHVADPMLPTPHDGSTHCHGLPLQLHGRATALALMAAILPPAAMRPPPVCWLPRAAMATSRHALPELPCSRHGCHEAAMAGHDKPLAAAGCRLLPAATAAKYGHGFQLMAAG